MTRARYPAHRGAERNYPHRVDIPVPPHGMGGRLNEMHAWCAAHIAGRWEQHGTTDRSRRDAQGIPTDVCRFYFADEVDAERFRLEWLPDA